MTAAHRSAVEAARAANIEARRPQNAPSDAGKGSPRDRTALNGLRTEADEEAACDKLIALYHGDVCRLSQRRASKIHIGLPDRRYRLPPYCVWWELKKPEGQLTRAQYDFLRAEWACGEFVGVGGIAELTPLVTLLRTTHLSLLEIRESSWHQVQAWADAFQFRTEPKRRPASPPF